VEPRAASEWSAAAKALLQTVLAKRIDDATQRSLAAAATAQTADGEQARRRAEQVRNILQHI
jgi:hypothetical protein